MCPPQPSYEEMSDTHTHTHTLILAIVNPFITGCSVGLTLDSAGSYSAPVVLIFP